MLARKKSSKIGTIIPQEWSESVARLLNETYKSECETNGRYFDVYGQVFPEELLLVSSYVSEKDLALTPYTVSLSCEPEQMANEEKVKETQKNYIDLLGLFFDEIFSHEEWDEFEPNWQEVTHNHQNYFYKISRENIQLSQEADRLLGPEFSDFDDEEELDH